MKSAARARTVAHMQRLVATATAATSVSCSRDADVKTVTITPLPQSTDTGVPPPPPAPTASATLTAPVPPVPPPDPSGYLVVDMLPAPARCLGVAAGSHATGKFRNDASGVILELEVTLSSSATSGVASFSGTPPSSWSSSVSSSTYKAQNRIAIARVRPTGPSSGQVSFGVTFDVNCGGAGTGSLAVIVSYAAPAVVGTSPTFTLHDY